MRVNKNRPGGVIEKLNKNEYLVYAGTTACRSPSGDLLEAVPQYIIVKSNTVPVNSTALTEGECLLLSGIEISGAERQSAEQRYKAALAGRRVRRKNDGVQQYVISDKHTINAKTKMNESEESTCERILDTMVNLYATAQREIKAKARQNGKRD